MSYRQMEGLDEGSPSIAPDQPILRESVRHPAVRSGRLGDVLRSLLLG